MRAITLLKDLATGLIIGGALAGCVHTFITPSDASLACDGHLKNYNHVLKKFECEVKREVGK